MKCDHAGTDFSITGDSMLRVAKHRRKDAVRKAVAQGVCPKCESIVLEEKEVLVQYARYALEAIGVDWKSTPLVDGSGES